MLKGKTIIELTDTKTGEVERYEDNNLVTEAINDVILKRRSFMGFNVGVGSEQNDKRSSFTSMFPLYKGFFGGIILFQNAVDESRKFLNGNDIIIGSATFGNAYSGTDSAVGSFNAEESEVNETEKYVRYVYDFATNQANGTISAVCLGNYHYLKHCLHGANVTSDYVTAFLPNVLVSPYNICGYGDNFQNNYDPNFVLFPTGINFKNDVPNDYTVPTSCYENPVLYDDTKGHLITFEYASPSGSFDTIRLHVYDLGEKSVSLCGKFDNNYYSRIIPKEVFTKDFSITAFGSYGQYSLQAKYCKQVWYDDSTGCAYVLGAGESTQSYWTNGTKMKIFKFNLNVENYEDITLETVDVTNKTGKQIYVATTYKAQSYERRICIKDGYLYAPLGTSATSADGVAKINLTDSTDVTIIDSGVYKFFAGIQGDYIYLSNLSSSYQYVKVLNTKTNELKSTRVQYSTTTHGAKPIPFKNNHMYCFYTGLEAVGTNSCGENDAMSSKYACWYGTPCSRNDYLATINNLENPVTKTSDKSMKITYILREV